MVELDGIRLLTDPLLGQRLGPLVRCAPPIAPESYAHVDAVLLSHMHLDHADLRSLRKLRAGVAIIAPPGAADWLRRKGFGNVRELAPGESAAVGAVEVVAVPARHDGRRHPLAAHAGSIGFVVRGSRSIYFAGDTSLFPEMAQIPQPLDLALMPVGGWGPTLGPGHLDPAAAALALRLLSPRVAIPIHWGTFALAWRRHHGPGHANAGPEFAGNAAEVAPQVEVRVLEPGTQTTLA